MTHLILYSTAGCHLCEQAHELVDRCLNELPASVHGLQISDIAEHADLMERYGSLIPVLRNEMSGQEVNWPFDAAAVKSLL